MTQPPLYPVPDPPDRPDPAQSTTPKSTSNSQSKPGANPKPQPSWRVLDGTDPISLATVQNNRSHLELARACTPEMDEVVTDVTSRLSVRMGIAESRVMGYIEIGLTLSRFPAVGAYMTQGHLSMEHMRAMAQCVECVPEDKREAIEEELVKRLSPRRANQATPTVKRIRAVARDVIAKHHPPARPKEDEPLPPPPPAEDEKPRFTWDDSTPLVTNFFLTLNKLDAAEFMQIIKYVAKHEECTQGEALMKVMRGQATAEVTLNIYRPVTGQEVDHPEGSVWVAGEWLSPMTGSEWLQRVTHLASPGYAKCEGYKPTPAIRAAVIGRDGHCRFPGCDIPAERCDLDHVHRWDHEDGDGRSETSTDNLHCLCRKHHRMKTSGQWDVALHRDGTEVWTSYGDGHVVVTEPGGVLGRETFEHLSVRRTKNLAEYNIERLDRQKWPDWRKTAGDEEVADGETTEGDAGNGETTEGVAAAKLAPQQDLNGEEPIPF